MKNEINILHQPKHSTISLILIDSDKFPISPEEHNAIDKLQEFSDVFFVFSDHLFPSTKGINKTKFTSLYESCGYIDGGGELCETYLISILYSLEIFETHIGFCITRISDLGDIKLEDYSKNIISLTASSISSPVFKTRRLGTDEFYKIYKNSNTGIFKKQEDSVNMYCSYTSDSKIMYFKRSSIGIIIDFWKSSENNKYFKSFSIKDPRYFFASVVKFLTIQKIDANINDLDIGTLR